MPRQLTWPGHVGKDLVLLPGCTNPALAPSKWANTAAGPHCSGATPGGWWTSGVTSKASTTALSDRLFLNREGHPLPPPSPRGTNPALKWETQQLLPGLATVIPTLRFSGRIDGRRGAVCSFAACLQELSPAHLWVTADVKSLRNTDPTVTCI